MSDALISVNDISERIFSVELFLYHMNIFFLHYMIWIKNLYTISSPAQTHSNTLWCILRYFLNSSFQQFHLFSKIFIQEKKNQNYKTYYKKFNFVNNIIDALESFSKSMCKQDFSFLLFLIRKKKFKCCSSSFEIQKCIF